jgi:hypothetical protein
MNKNDVDRNALRESWREILDGVFAKKQKKPRDLNLRAQKPAPVTPDKVAEHKKGTCHGADQD